MKLFKPVFLGLLGLAITSCMTVRSISVNQLPKKEERHTLIKSRDWSPKILLIPFGTGYIDNARISLMDQCREGVIEGVLSKQEETNYVFWLYSVQSVSMRGYCVRLQEKRVLKS